MHELKITVEEGDTTKDAEASTVIHTEITTTMTGGTPGTNRGGVGAMKTIDG